MFVHQFKKTAVNGLFCVNFVSKNGKNYNNCVLMYMLCKWQKLITLRTLLYNNDYRFCNKKVFCVYILQLIHILLYHFKHVITVYVHSFSVRTVKKIIIHLQKM